MANEFKTPKRLKGFNDFFAKDMKIREFIINTFKETFEKYGYEPLETPALEYSELILGQSGEEAEKQYYRFQDAGGRDVMLKYEVMISMCRAVAQNINNIPFPYKRYQIQRVWRAENVQKGRYREFTQCDADTIGTNSMRADAEFIQMGLEIVGKLGFKEYVARISNRKFLEGLAEYLNIPEAKRYSYMMSIDKLEKIGADKVIAEMIEQRGIDPEAAKKTFEILDLEKYRDMAFRDTVDGFRDSVGSTRVGKEGLDELVEILNYLETVGVDPKLYRFDITIARGLASYTGPVWEFTVLDGGVGSIAGAGRYDKAIGKYIGQDIPATGGSFGIERLMDIIKDRNMWDFPETTAKVMVAIFSEELVQESIKVAEALRSKGIETMLYPDAAKLDKQFKYADRKKIPYVVVIGPEEKEKSEVVLKDMNTTSQEKINLEALLAKLQQ